MLLEGHLKVIGHWADDVYYMHVLNIQMDVCELTGNAPLIPSRKVNPMVTGLSLTGRLKALALRLFGIKGICNLNRIIHKTTGRHS